MNKPRAVERIAIKRGITSEEALYQLEERIGIKMDNGMDEAQATWQAYEEGVA